MMEDLLADYRTSIHARAEEWLRPYLNTLTPAREPRTKEVNDAVWGTLQLRPEEVVYLDSPLLQRLRRVKQLGVVHYVYPAATHSRLEHSLGVVHQVQNLITSINTHGLSRSTRGHTTTRVVPEHLERLLRLAALCHDIGHGFMSHVSEYGLEYKPEVASLRYAFQRDLKRPSLPQLSEMAAYYIIDSPAFKELADQATSLASMPIIANQADTMKKLILGLQVDEQLMLIHELVSGPFDADKLDYLTRDAVMCGVPRVTDVPRLVQKVRAAEVVHKNLTTPLKRATSPSQQVLHVTGIARAGGRTLDELALARTLMFDKVYRHQKVRATESMVFGIVLELAKLVDHPALAPFLIEDDQVYHLDRSFVCSIVEKSYASMDDQDRTSVDTIVSLSARLRDRDLFVRGLAFAATMTGDAYSGEIEHTSGVKRFLDDTNIAEPRSAFVTSVATRVARLMKLLQWPSFEDEANLTSFLWLSPPRPAPKTTSSDTGHAHLIDPDGTLTQVESDAAETIPWADAYVATRDLGHLFCPAPIAPLVYIAGEAELRARYGVRLPPSMLQYAKQDERQIEDLKRQLLKTDWYADLPLDLQPLPSTLLMGDARDRAERISDRLHDYAGPSQIEQALKDSHRKRAVHPEQVFQFVRQFGRNDLVDVALTTLENVAVIGRQEARSAVQSFLDRHPEFHGGSYCTLGEAKDSSALLTYYVGDVAEEYDLTQLGLAEALLSDHPVIFVDDFVGTGTQVANIFQHWLGQGPARDLGEVRPTLSADLQERLRSRRIALIFVAGMEEGRRTLEDFFTRINMDVCIQVHRPEAELPFLSRLGIEPGQLRDFEQFCRDRAREVLPTLWAKNRDSTWVEDRLLGYGNHGLLLTSTFNTPTATLTCLWARSSSAEWTPLLPRRTKR